MTFIVFGTGVNNSTNFSKMEMVVFTPKSEKLMAQA